MTPLTADIAVLGSGFGGCLTALILERIGYRPIVIDKGTHPRFAIGESSTPTADAILRDLAGCYGLPQFEPLSRYGTWQATYPELGVGLKRGFSYFYHRPGASFYPDAHHSNELLVAASASDAFADTHWLRADVDAFFAAEVVRAGIPLFEQTEAGVRPEGAGWLLEGVRAGAEPFAARASFLIDATGAGGVLPRTLDLYAAPDAFETHSRALYTHVRGVRRWEALLSERGALLQDHPFRCDDAALHHVFEGGWMWVLRFDDDRVSAGFVLDTRLHPVPTGMRPEAEWEALIGTYPALREQFEGAAQVAPPGAVVRTGRLQRKVTRAAGPNWALLPSTAGFIDPLHSTGIAHTLSGVERLAKLFASGRDGPARARALRAYSDAVLRELDLVDALVAACYASSGSFRAYTASVLLYFAAVVTSERHRAEGRAGAFLGADNPAYRAIVHEALARLREGEQGGGVEDQSAFDAGYTAFIEAAIEPYNAAGLFRPPRPNMYHHTASKA